MINQFSQNFDTFYKNHFWSKIQFYKNLFYLNNLNFHMFLPDTYSKKMTKFEQSWTTFCQIKFSSEFSHLFYVPHLM